jgi:AbrB family looped-hinge helix DNA binding protein
MSQVVTNYSSAIDKRGRITVPREVRLRLGLSAGDRVEFVVEDERIIFRPARPVARVFEKYAGILGKFPGGKK